MGSSKWLKRWSRKHVAQITYLGIYVTPATLRAGTRRNGESTGGRFAAKGIPTIKDNELELGTEPAPAIGPPNNWDQRKVKAWGAQTTFTRTVEDGVVTVTTNCDDPTLMLLARKGDGDYWLDGVGWAWHDTHKALWPSQRGERRRWCADIARRMLEEGLVATDNESGTQAAMNAAGSQKRMVKPVSNSTDTSHVLTAVVAQMRGLRLIESMSPSISHRETTFGGYEIPSRTTTL